MRNIEHQHSVVYRIPQREHVSVAGSIRLNYILLYLVQDLYASRNVCYPLYRQLHHSDFGNSIFRRWMMIGDSGDIVTGYIGIKPSFRESYHIKVKQFYQDHI